MKYIIFLLLAILPFSANAAEIGEIGGGLQVPVTSTSNNNVASSGDLEQAFCNSSKITGKGEPRVLSPRENKIVVETFANTLGQDIQKQYDLTGLQIALQRNSSQPAYNELESLCLQYRASSGDREQTIENLYTQVVFFTQYYSPYPESLKDGIIPNFLIFLIDAIDTVSFYLIWLAFFNIIFWVAMFGLSQDKKKILAIDRIKLAIIYLLILWAIKVGIVGGLVTYVGYDNLEFIRLIFNF